MKWIRNLVGHKADDIAEDIAAHLEEKVADLMECGLSEKEARLQANREFGNATLITETGREVWGRAWLEEFGQDIRYATRGLQRDLLLTLAATLTLTVCIAANTTVFSIVKSVLLRPLPYPDSNRIYWLSERAGRDQMEIGLGPDYYSLRQENKVFEDVAAYDGDTVNWTGVEAAEQLRAAQVTPSFFGVMGTQPMMGRYLAPEEEGRQPPAVVVLSYAFWRNRMGNDAHVVGTTITLNRMPHTVIGVMPQGFNYPNGAAIWKPLAMDEATQTPRAVTTAIRLVWMVARLKPQVGERQLSTEMSRLTRKIRAEYPKEFEKDGFLNSMKFSAIPLKRRMAGDLRPALHVLSGAVGLVLLIACVNLANLLLARAAARRRELAVRLALGSARSRIVRQVLVESLALALPGGLAGIAVAYLTVEGLKVWQPLVLQNHPAITMDFSTLAFTCALTLLTGLVFGVAPALASAGVTIQDILKSGSHQYSGGRKTTRLRQLLVVVELGVSLVLLIGAGLLARSFLKLARTDLGFNAEKLLTLRVNLAGAPYATPDSQVRFYDDLLERVKELPSVHQAAVSADVPLESWRVYSRMRFQVPGRAPVPFLQWPETNVSVVSRDFFQTLGIPLRAGRAFDWQDTAKSSESIVVNEAFARAVFSGANPLGQVIASRRDGSSRWMIVGVAGNIRGSDLGAEPGPLVYRCTCQGHVLSGMSLIVRTGGEARASLRAVEGRVYTVDRHQPAFGARTMEERLADSLSPQRFHLVLIGTFALIAMILAALGVYGVMSYLVMRRTREIGIRMAMGARPEQVVRLVVGESMALASLAVLAGLGGAWALTRYLNKMLYGVTALDATTFAMMSVTLTILALAASLVPARRASRIDPTVALREE